MTSFTHVSTDGKRLCIPTTDARALDGCRSGSSWKTQDEHPHPIYNHASNAVFFTSDKQGKRAVFSVDVPVNLNSGIKSGIITE